MLRPWKLEIIINFECDTPVYIQIVNTIIDAIKSRKLAVGSALPGSRKLAKLLEVNRNTVVRALDILTVEGWLVAKDRKGIFVNEHLPDLQEPPNKFGEETLKRVSKPLVNIVFDDGIPDSKTAPMKELARAYRRVFNQKSRWKMMGYGSGQGTLEFREAITQMLNFKRGLHFTADELCITRGSQMAMYLLAHVLFKPGDKVVVENPGYRPAWHAFEQAGAEVVSINVDESGLSVDKLTGLLEKGLTIKAVYVTPHHQYPTTVTMTLERRLQLIKLSNRYRFTIIEDDYDHEFHFVQRPILPISSNKEAQHIVYIGSMSKVVAPALRIGYLSAKPDLVKQIVDLRKIIDVQGDIIMELAVLDLINSGEIRRHLKRATTYYKEKRDRFARLLADNLGNKVSFHIPDGGLAFWVRPNENFDGRVLCENLIDSGIEIIHPDKFSEQTVDGVRLGYASLSDDNLKRGLEMIGGQL